MALHSKEGIATLRRLGRRVAELRLALGLTQEGFAARAGWSVKYVQRIEGGRANLTVLSLVDLGNLLSTDLPALFQLSADEFAEDN